MAEDARTVADVLADNLHDYRVLRGLEQAIVASRMQVLGHTGWRQSTVSDVERGRRNVTVPELVSLVVVLGVSVERLLDPRGPMRRFGPKLLTGADPEHADVPGSSAVEPRHVTALVCDHELLVEPDWYAEALLRKINYTGTPPGMEAGE